MFGVLHLLILFLDITGYLRGSTGNVAVLLMLSWLIQGKISSNCQYGAVVGDYINTVKTNLYSKFLLLTSFFIITSLQVIKKKLFF